VEENTGEKNRWFNWEDNWFKAEDCLDLPWESD
jgi:hypothetical protein